MIETDDENKNKACVDFEWLDNHPVPIGHEASLVSCRPIRWQDELRDKDPDEAEYDCVETVMVNAGFVFRIFTQEDKAIAWLIGESTN